MNLIPSIVFVQSQPGTFFEKQIMYSLGQEGVELAIIEKAL